MVNKLRGEVEVQNKRTGDVYILRFSANARIAVKHLLNVSVEKLFSRSMKGELEIGDEELRAMLYCGMKEFKPTITLEEAGELLSDIGQLEAIKKIDESLAAQNPSPSEESKKKEEVLAQQA